MLRVTRLKEHFSQICNNYILYVSNFWPYLA
jgi:hypothetical protein